jgi:hypothetical protein
MNTNEECPCEECISLAICYQKNRIKCEDLYRFVCIVEKLSHGGERFNCRRSGVNPIIFKIFKRCVTGTNIRKYAIVLEKNTGLFPPGNYA